MKIVIFGLTASSSWGNGHATLWRGLCRALARLGHRVEFFEKDMPYYAEHRDLIDPCGWALHIYMDWDDVRRRAERELADADVGMVTSYCPDGIAATRSLMGSLAERRCFYDMDTPVTLERAQRGEPIEYIDVGGLADFDLVLSYTGGAAVDALRERLGARRVATLYGSADPNAYEPVGSGARRYRSSYLGTYAPDRQATLEALLFEPARRLPEDKFVIGGSLYPDGLCWPANVDYLAHVPPPEHPGFYGSAQLTLNVTRGIMARMGYCPSGRLFESAACGVPVLSDWWEGLDQFFEPGQEILVARSSEEAVAMLCRSPEELARIGRAARQRVLAEHTADARAQHLVTILEELH